jgi:hypothetical protein
LKEVTAAIQVGSVNTRHAHDWNIACRHFKPNQETVGGAIVSFPLTLTLSLREREQLRPGLEQSDGLGFAD